MQRRRWRKLKAKLDKLDWMILVNRGSLCHLYSIELHLQMGPTYVVLYSNRALHRVEQVFGVLLLSFWVRAMALNCDIPLNP